MSWSARRSYSNRSEAGNRTIEYFVFTPRTANANQTGMPLFCWLHGYGDSIRAASPFKVLDDGSAPWFTLRPQAPIASNWGLGRFPGSGSGRLPRSWQAVAPLRLLVALLDYLSSSLPVDATRIAMGGVSMGAYATWDLLVRNLGRFVVAVPISGGGDPSCGRLLNGTSIWAWHGLHDKTVPVRASQDMVAAMARARGMELENVSACGGWRGCKMMRAPDDRLRHTELEAAHFGAERYAMNQASLVEWVAHRLGVVLAR
jgi:predicted peptidase